MLRAVIFDFNGIIVNDEPIHCKLFQRVFAEEGIALTDEDYYARYLGFDDRGAFEAGFLANHRLLSEAKLAELIGRKASYYQEAIRHHAEIFPGVKPLVAELANRFPLAVASGALRSEIEAILTTAGLLEYFCRIISAEDVKRGKPDPEIFLAALSALNANAKSEGNIAANDCVVIEDSKEGIKGARRAGMKCVAVTNSHPPELLGEADLIVKSLELVTPASLEKLCA